ncbi:MAG TPA: hypothetical protein VMR25_13140 [Planctomycetaceae bacterium]|nr:hypothetical protein [Planctomycetaceae bacterium]
MNTNVSGLPVLPLLPMLMLCFWVATIVVHVVFAFAVDNDASRIKRTGGATFLVGRFGWALATLVAGPLVAAAYWIIHHSALTIEMPSAMPAE